MKWKPAFRKTKSNYVYHLNGLSPSFESEDWIIGGKRRNYYAQRKQYGVALRKYDPIAFQVGYQEWRDN